MKFITSIIFFLVTLRLSAQAPAGAIPPPPEERGAKSEDYVYTLTEEVPEFPGGIIAMREYVKTHLNYPAEAREAGTIGKSFVKFIVDKEGNIKDPQIFKSLPGCKDCDDEAIKLIKGMPKWKPAKMEGKAVNCWFTFPISFKPE